MKARHAFLLALTVLCHLLSACAHVDPPAERATSLQQAVAILEAESKASARSFSTRDFGREKYTDAISVLVEEEDAEDVLRRVRERLGAGLISFIGTTRSLTEPPAKGVEVVVAPGASQLDILRVAASDAVNYDLQTEDLIPYLEKWDRAYGIDIFQAETDTIQFRLKTLPADLKAFAEELYQFCPDIVDQGTGSVEALEEEIRTSRSVYLWWD